MDTRARVFVLSLSFFACGADPRPDPTAGPPASTASPSPSTAPSVTTSPDPADPLASARARSARSGAAIDDSRALFASVRARPCADAGNREADLRAKIENEERNVKAYEAQLGKLRAELEDLGQRKRDGTLDVRARDLDQRFKELQDQIDRAHARAVLLEHAGCR